MRGVYTVTDEAGRKFPLRRYKTGLCRFELYNCAYLGEESGPFGALADFTVLDAPRLSADFFAGRSIKHLLPAATRGHFISPVL